MRNIAANGTEDGSASGTKRERYIL